jgi:hypothetical protein
MLLWVENAYVPKSPLETKLVQYMGSMTLDKKGLDNIVTITSSMDKFLEKLAESPETREYAFTLTYLCLSLYKACRRCAYLELKLSLLNMCTEFLPDKDQAAVCLEMSTTQSNLREIFNLSSNQLSKPFHDHVREILSIENSKLTTGESEEPEHVEQFSFKNLDFTFAKQIGNSYIYIYPILVDFIIGAIIGSGLFVSSKMDFKTLQASTLTFLFSFPFIGGVMNSFGRTLSFYFYQKSISLMIMSASHRLAGSIAILFGVGILNALVIYLVVGSEPGLMVLGFLNSILFGYSFSLLYS